MNQKSPRNALPLSSLQNESYDTNTINESPAKGMAKVNTRLVINHALPIHQGTFICLAESGSQYTTTKTKLVIARKNDKNFTTLLATDFLGVHHVPRITLWISNLMDILGESASTHISVSVNASNISSFKFLMVIATNETALNIRTNHDRPQI